jgi:lipocalin-like protein
MKNFLFIIISTAIFGCQSSELKTQPIEANLIEGVWEITQIIYQTPGNQYANPAPQAGIFIFTKNYYSMTWNPNDTKQENYKDKWRPTDNEKIESYNSIITNSGTYEIAEGKLVTTPITAKTPAFIGGKAIYDYLVNESSLTLTLLEVISHDGVYDEGVKNHKTTIKLKKIE